MKKLVNTFQKMIQNAGRFIILVMSKSVMVFVLAHANDYYQEGSEKRSHVLVVLNTRRVNMYWKELNSYGQTKIH